MQIYTLEHEKRGLRPYDDKRYLFVNMPDGSRKPNTHAYGHRDILSEDRLEVDMPDRSGMDLMIERHQQRQEPEHDEDSLGT